VNKTNSPGVVVVAAGVVVVAAGVVVVAAGVVDVAAGVVVVAAVAQDRHCASQIDTVTDSRAHTSCVVVLWEQHTLSKHA